MSERPSHVLAPGHLFSGLFEEEVVGLGKNEEQRFCFPANAPSPKYLLVHDNRTSVGLLLLKP